MYHVTTITLDRQPVFSDLRSARVLINALREAQTRGDATMLAFVVMPDHMHWLLELGTATSLSGLVGAVKAVTAHGLGRRIWHNGFHDHALRREEYLAKVARPVGPESRRGRRSHRCTESRYRAKNSFAFFPCFNDH